MNRRTDNLSRVVDATMRGLTLYQPWATLIALGLKMCETRGHPSPPGLKGRRIAIHAGKRKPRADEMNDEVLAAIESEILPLGAIVATARLDGCARIISAGFAGIDEVDAEPGRVWVLEPDGLEQRDAYQIRREPYGDFREGRYVWLLSDVMRVSPPVPARGYMGFWGMDDDLTRTVLARQTSILGHGVEIGPEVVSHEEAARLMGVPVEMVDGLRAVNLLVSRGPDRVERASVDALIATGPVAEAYSFLLSRA